MNCGPVRFGSFRPALFRPVKFCRGRLSQDMETTLVQERSRIDAGGVGRGDGVPSLGRASSGPVGHGCINHHAAGAVLASTPDGGIKLGHCTAGSGDARLGGATLVWPRRVKATVFVVAVRFGVSRRRHLPNPGDMALDPFAGSGTTVAVAKRMGREATGIELNPAYAEIAERRLEVVA